jgi:hypothetical protein
VDEQQALLRRIGVEGDDAPSPSSVNDPTSAEP